MECVYYYNYYDRRDANIDLLVPFARADCDFMTIDAAGTVARTTLNHLIDTIPPENADRDFTEQLEEDTYVNSSSYTISSNELDNELRYWTVSAAGIKRAPLKDLLAGSNWLTVTEGLIMLLVTLIFEYAAGMWPSVLLTIIL